MFVLNENLLFKFFQAFANKEDLKSDKQKVVFNDEDVERVRRAHRNDLENVLPFIVIGFLYTLTNPAAGLAILLFRIGALARIVHTLVYAVVVIPQPARALSWMVCFASTFYMAVGCTLFFM